MNPTQNIMVFDMPRRLRAGFLSLISEGSDPSIENGNIISEVGEPIQIKTPIYATPFLAYQLRKPRKYVIPDHNFGKMYLGNAFAAFLPRVISLPAIGTSTVLQPRCTPEQGALMDLFKYVHANFLWIIHIPAPLGVGVLVEIYAPELDSTTSTRSVRFRPAGCNTIALSVPWSNDLSVVPVNSARKGQSGGAITIRVVEDNTTDTVNTPLNVTVYQAVVDVALTTKVPAEVEFTSRNGLLFSPQTPPTVAQFEHHGDEDQSTEVNAEGSAHLSEQVSIDATPATEIAPEVEKPMGKPPIPARATATRNQTGAVGTRWFESMTFTAAADRLMTWQNLTIDPRNLTARGENISLAYRRNVWVQGSQVAGYSRTLATKFVVARPPQLSGAIEIADSRNDSSRYIVEFGGNVEVRLMPRNFSGATPQARPRYYNNRYLRTDEAMVDFRHRLVAFNRTADAADITVRVLVKVGESSFHVPTKPRPNNNQTRWLVDQLTEFTTAKDLQILANEPIVGFVQHGDDEGDNTFDSTMKIAPLPALLPYMGEVNDGEAFNEDIDQDDFAVEIWSGKLPVGSIVAIPLNMSVAPDLSGTGGMSTIAQKFERNAHIIPTGKGAFGPSIGTYTIETRLPTTISGQIAHVSLPGDMVDEAAVFAFGLGSLLSMASSAIQAIGGPTLGAALNTGRAIFDVVKGIGGSIISKNKSESVQQPSASGPIDISRFVNFLKPVLENELADPTFGSLLVHARDFLGIDGTPIEEIPARIWARMDKSKIERSLFNRLITPENTMVNELRIPYDRWSYIADMFGAHPETFKTGTHQNQCWLKFISCIRRNALKSDVTSLSLQEILNYEVSQEDELALEDIMSSKQLILQP